MCAGHKNTMLILWSIIGKVGEVYLFSFWSPSESDEPEKNHHKNHT